MGGRLPAGTSIACLPDEVLHKIFNRVSNDAGNEAFLLAEVCKHWRALMRTAICRVTLAQSPSPVAAVLDLTRFENLESVSVRDCIYGNVAWSPAFEAISKTCKHMSSILLQRISPGLSAMDIATLFQSFPRLHSLAIDSSLSLPHLHPFAAMTSLRSLSLSNVPWLEALPPLDPLVALTSLTIDGIKVHSIPPVRALTNLRALVITRAESLPELPELRSLRLLSTLDLHGCARLALLDVAGLSSLQRLRLGGCSQLHALHGLCDVEASLTELDFDFYALPNPAAVLAHAPRLHELSARFSNVSVDVAVGGAAQELRLLERALGRLTSLAALTLDNVAPAPGGGPFNVDDGSSDASGGDAFPTLRSFALTNSANVDRVPAMVNVQRMPALTSVEVAWCEDLKSIAELGALGGNLRCLRVTACTRLRALPSFEALPNLAELALTFCPSLVALPESLAALGRLSRLDLQGCAELRAVPPLIGLNRLRELCLASCRGLTTLPALVRLIDLESLDVGGCAQLRSLPDLPPGLRFLATRECVSLGDLPPLAGLRDLHDLDLSGCVMLERLPPLCALTSLLSLRLESCKRLPEVPPLGALGALRRINVVGCRQLRRMPHLSSLRSLRRIETCKCMLASFEGGLPLNLMVLHSH